MVFTSIKYIETIVVIKIKFARNKKQKYLKLNHNITS